MKKQDTYKENGLEGLVGCEPTCPKCGHSNAMLNDYRPAEKLGIKPWEGTSYVCRDCGYIHIFKIK